MGFLYSRVSTGEQHPDAQLERLRVYACSDPRIEGLPREYREVASSRSTRRPQLEKMLRDLSAHPGGVVFVVAFDRLARSVLELHRIVERIHSSRGELVCLQTALDTRTPTGRLILSVLGAFAELEREQIRERTCAGLAAARKRGNYAGRPRVIVDRAEAEELLRTKTTREAAAALGVSESTLYVRLREWRAADRRATV